jgi:hypothetical protein
MNLSEQLAQLKQRYATDKKFRITVISSTAGAAVLIVAISYATAAYFDQQRRPLGQPLLVSGSGKTTQSTLTPSPSPTPATAFALLDGTNVAASSYNLHPLAVMIENHPDARPQSGLGAASLTYEAIAEGGITRFLAIYRDPTIATKVGPIRSARSYFVNFARELNAFYAHAGGNRDALDLIPSAGVQNLDGLVVGNPTFTRDFSRGVAQEHTLYSSTEKLWQQATERSGWSKTASFTSWKYQEVVPSNLPASQTIGVAVSSQEYQVRWQYDSASNTYLRTMAGQAHRDANTGEQIRASNIILQTVNRTPTKTRVGEEGWIYDTRGSSGSVVVIRNGTTIKGTWAQRGDERTKFMDSTGAEIPLARGTTWVHIIHPDSLVTY